MIGRKEAWGCSRPRAVAIPMVVVLGILTCSTNAAIANSPGRQKDKVNDEEDTTRVYTNSYDEVFQATQDAIQRIGLFVKAADKNKGTIAGNGDYLPKGATATSKVDFEINIEVVSPKPETRMTVNATAVPSLSRARKARIEAIISGDFRRALFIEIQKVLATYH